MGSADSPAPRATGPVVMTVLTLFAFLAAILVVWTADWAPEANPFRIPEPDGPPRGKKNFTGSQISTRQAFGYGIYVFEVLPNVDKRAVATTLATFIPRPPPGDYLQASRIWRMTEIDLTFAPQSLQPQPQFVTCEGHFPHARCNVTRSGDADSSDVVAMANAVPGAYTDDTLVRAVVNNIKRFKKEGRPEWFNFTNADLADLRTWDDLVNATGEGGLFSYPTDWPLPQALCFAWNTTTCVNRTMCLHVDRCVRNMTCDVQCPALNSTSTSVTECNNTEAGKGCLTDCEESFNYFTDEEFRVSSSNEWGLPEGQRLDYVVDKRCNSSCPKHTTVTNHTTVCTTTCDQLKTIRTHAHCAHYKFCWVNTTAKRKNAESVCVQTLPPKQSRTNMLKTTVYRMPAGPARIQEGGISAGFLPHSKVDEWDVSGYIMASSGGISNPTFNPYTFFHTYTIQFSPEGIFFYVNAPGKGFDIANAQPVFNMSAEEYPDIKMMGPDMPGGDIPWEPLHGPASMKRQGLGLSQMSVKMFFDEEQGGVVKDFKCTDTFVRRLAYRPMPPPPPPPANLSNGTNTTTTPPPPAKARPGEQPFEVDFSKFNASHWWSSFRETFMVDHDDTGVRSGANLDFGLAPDLGHALILKGCQREQMINKAVYQLSPGGWAQVLDYKSGYLWAEAMVPRFDLVPLPASGSVQVWVVVKGGRCAYQLGPHGWHLSPGKGDLLNGTLCSFLQTANEPSHVFFLPDGSKKLLLTPAPNAISS